jgi:hypothetical protein
MTTYATFQTQVVRLLTQTELPGGKYFTITLLADDTGHLQWGVQTLWCGYTDTMPRREIRKGRLYRGEAQRAFYLEHGEPALLINNGNDLAIWLAFGGHGVVFEEIGTRHFPDLVGEQVSAADSGGLGFRHLEDLTEAQLQHAPSKKLRMQVLNRDGRRCMICGRSAAFYVDVELHVHHAIPWGKGGITEEANLITLCKTCHDGLDPHYDLPLTRQLAYKYPRPKPRYLDSLSNYQQWVRARGQSDA